MRLAIGMTTAWIVLFGYMWLMHGVINPMIWAWAMRGLDALRTAAVGGIGEWHADTVHVHLGGHDWLAWTAYGFAVGIPLLLCVAAWMALRLKRAHDYRDEGVR